MYKNIIINYINKLTKQDINNFLIKNNIIITNNELDILYYYIKNKYNDFFINEEKVFNEIKDKLQINTYKELYKLYIIYNNKYNIKGLIN